MDVYHSLMFDFLLFSTVGDTFRWKGENVSTAEVESVISKALSLRDVVVYGVKIPGNEGKAGMAAISDPDNHVDLDNLSDHLKKSLPAYAKPVFIRKQCEVKPTGIQSFSYSNSPIYFNQKSDMGAPTSVTRKPFLITIMLTLLLVRLIQCIMKMNVYPCH